jgi:hypothetical protein
MPQEKLREWIEGLERRKSFVVEAPAMQSQHSGRDSAFPDHSTFQNDPGHA